MKLFLFCVIFFSCTDFLNTWDGWEIKKGKHFSKRSGIPTRGLSLKDGRHLKFKARFMPSCLYTPENDDINKLYGFTDCNSGVHQNSVRFGWRHDGKGNIEIFAYWYADGKRGFKKMGVTKAEVHNEYEIWAKGDEYLFRFDDAEFTTPRLKNCSNGIRVRLFPYFGGDRPAPNDMMILIYEFD